MNPFESTIAFFSPRRALNRARARAALRVYDAATPGRRGSSFKGRGASANTEIGHAIGPLRDRAHEMVRNSPWAPRMLDVFGSHAIGTGLSPVPHTGSDRLDVKVSELWEEWQMLADVEEVQSFYGQQVLGLRSMMETGEVIFRFVNQEKSSRRRTKVPMELQLLEADFIDTTRDGLYGESASSGTQRSRLGVGLGPWDKRTGLWLYQSHPGDMTVSTRTGSTWDSKFVPNDELIHLFRAERPGQVRGVTWFAPILMTARDLADFFDALVVKARVEACISGFVTQTLDDVDPVFPTSTVYTDPNNQADVAMLEPGTIKNLRPGQDIKFAQPTSTSQVEPVLMMALMGMSAGIGCTYDQVTGDLRNANYSSLRAGSIHFRKLVEQVQKLTLIPRVCQPVWDKFISQAIIAGELRERSKGYPCEWVTPAWQSINPKFDEDAEIRSARAGRITPQQLIASWGGNWRKNVNDASEYFKYCEEKGVVFETEVGKITRAGSTQPVAKVPGEESSLANGSGNGHDPSLSPEDVQDMLDEQEELEQ